MIVTDRTNLWTNPNGMRPATRTIVVHHAAATYPAGIAAEKIYSYHAKKWPDYHAAAYHEILDRFPDGAIRCSIMNPPGIIGAGVYGRNDDTFHICAATNFLGIPADDWIDAIAQRCAAAMKRYSGAVVRGHKEITIPGHQTACPGALWDQWKPRLKARIDELLRPDTGGAYLVLGLPIYQTPELTIPCGTLPSDTPVVIGKTYANGAGWLANGAGFVDMDGLGRAEK